MTEKKFSQVVNLPVIHVQEGAMLGKVRSLRIDPQTKKVTSCEIMATPRLKDLPWYLPFASIRLFGPDAVIVNEAAAVEEGLSEEPPSPGADLLAKNVVSETGHFLGEVKDYTFNTAGDLLSIYLKAGLGDAFLKGEQPIPATSLLTIGGDFIVLRGDYFQDLPGRDTTAFRQIRDKGMEITHSLEVRAIEFALDKKVKRHIHGRDGALILAKGGQVTPEVIDAAREQGRLPQLLLAAGVGEVIDALDVPREKLDAGSKKLVELWERIKSRPAAENQEGGVPDLKGDAEEDLADPWEEDLEESLKDSLEGELSPPPPEDTFQEAADEPSEEGRKEKGKEKPADEEGELEEFLDQLQSFSRTTAAKLEKTSYSAMRRYLRDRYAPENIVGPGGQVLAEKEQLIDDDVIARAEELGLLSHLFIGVFKEEVQFRLENVKDMLAGLFKEKN
jgi:sporulation protein YlmC with PRC-barrel domain